ncbi:MAG: Lrp/AsnC family transcriptional regulator [Bacillota bacterium]|nr:Lrp/AsnC family transcriptional regulator [Bacillota bacterium]
MFSELDLKIIRALQEDLPLIEEPFKAIATQLEITETELLDKIHYFIENGYIRRFGAAIRHREAGFTANAMVVWEVNEEKTKEVGAIMAQFPEVSHCYQRPKYPDWPYNMFTMVHGKTKEQCWEIAKKISEKIQIDKYNLLFSTDELKKISMKYFV